MASRLKKIYLIWPVVGLVVIGVILLAILANAKALGWSNAGKAASVSDKSPGASGASSGEDDNSRPVTEVTPDYTVSGSLPKGWSLSDKNKGSILKGNKIVGGIEIIGYYGGQGDKPNHSTVIKAEEVKTGLGQGTLFELNSSDPAAASTKDSWLMLWAVVPVQDRNLAYAVWVNTSKAQLRSDTTAVKEILTKLAPVRQ